MAEGRAPEDLQEAVAATLRRLRGEVGAPRPAPARVEPQFSAPMPRPAAEELPPPRPAPAHEGPVAEAAPPAEPDLLDSVASQTDIPPAPSSYEPQSYAPTAEAPELRAPSSYDVEEAPGTSAPPRRHWLRYVVALAVLVVFAAVGWWAYRHFVGRAGNGPIPVVTADQTPEKVPPADQPANQTPTQQETVYNQIAPGGSSTTQQPEVLLPQPETPAAPPVPSSSSQPSAAPASTATASGAAASGATGSATSGATPPAAPAAAAAPAADTNSSAGNTTLTETLLPSPSTASSASPPSAAPAANQGTASQTQTSAAPAPASQSAATQTATAAPAAPATTGSTDAGQAASSGAAAAPANDAPTAVGNYRVQLAALKTEADANSAWKRLAAKYPDVLGSLAPHLEKADLGTKGIYYRVQAGPFTDKNAARDVCAKLKTLGQQCLVKP